MCMMKYTASLLITLSFLFVSCVEEYKVPETTTRNYKDELVIQGRILSGEESIFYVARTTPFGSKTEPIFVTDAKVTIIGQNGFESPVAEYYPEKQCYQVDTKLLPDNTQYALKVVSGNEIYQSEYQSLQTSPEITNVTYHEEENNISINVTTLSDDNFSRYYMWSYEEDWEFHADNDIKAMRGVILYDKEWYPLLDKFNNPYYYCWGHNSSSQTIIYTTSPLSENTVKDVKLLDIPSNDIRISYIYSILVKQWSLSMDAYTYYKTMKLYTEESGSLFIPMPGELKNNVSCITNPDLKCHGYVLASTVSTKRLFIYENDLVHFRSDYQNCALTYPPLKEIFGYDWRRAWLNSMEDYGFVIYTNNGDLEKDSSILYSPECVDCRKTKGATKKRPDFWPNNHE